MPLPCEAVRRRTSLEAVDNELKKDSFAQKEKKSKNREKMAAIYVFFPPREQDTREQRGKRLSRLDDTPRRDTLNGTRHPLQRCGTARYRRAGLVVRATFSFTFACTSTVLHSLFLFFVSNDVCQINGFFFFEKCGCFFLRLFYTSTRTVQDYKYLYCILVLVLIKQKAHRELTIRVQVLHL